jgi:hypothetical protein
MAREEQQHDLCHMHFFIGHRGDVIQGLRKSLGKHCQIKIHDQIQNDGFQDNANCDPYVLFVAHTKDLVDRATTVIQDKIDEHVEVCNKRFSLEG